MKPEFWTHPLLSKLQDHSRLMAIGVLNLADDEGYFRAESALVRAALRPFDDGTEKTTEALRELSSIGYVTVFHHAEGGVIGKVINFRKHQKINKPSPSKLRQYDDSVNAPGMLSEDYPTEGKGMEGKRNGMEGNGGEGPPPVEFPPGFPESEKQAVDWIRGTLAVPDAPDAWIIEMWNQAIGRGFKDGAEVQIRNWAKFIAGRWPKEKQRQLRDSAKGAEKKEGAAPAMKPIAADAPPDGWETAADRVIDFDWRNSDHRDWPSFAEPMKALVRQEIARQKKLRADLAREPDGWQRILLNLAKRNGWTLGEIADSVWHELPANMKIAVLDELAKR